MKINLENLDFPLERKLSTDYLQQNYWECLYKTTKDNVYHYSVPLPERIKPVQLEPVILEGLNLTNIGQYVSVDSLPYLEVWVCYENYQYEMNASDWLQRKLFLTGEVILKSREIKADNGSGKYLDALCYKKFPDEKESISRYTVLKEYNRIKGGANYFFIKATCQLTDYEQLADDIFYIVSYWKVLEKPNWHLAELQQIVKTQVLTNMIVFSISDSWEVLHSENRIIIEHNIDNGIYGVINLFFYEKASYKTEKDVYKSSVERLLNEDAVVNITKLEAINLDNPIIINAVKFEGDIKITKDNQGYFCAHVLKVDNMWCYFELVGGHKNKVDYSWEVNMRCLEMILESFNTTEIV